MATFAEHGIRVQVPGAEEQKTTCPRCSETRKNKTERCLSVNTIKGVWRCHHCEWSGALDGKSHRRVEFYALPTDKLPKPMPNPLREKLIEYFAGRAIPADVLGRNNVTMEMRFVAATEKEERCIAFAYYVDGSVVNVKYRDARKNFTQTKDGARIFYKIDDVKDQAEVIICEGEIDALSWEVAGYRNAISVPDGAPAPTASNVAVKMRFLDNAADRLEHVERFVIAVDNDPPGKRLQAELVRRLGVERCWIVNYPPDCKDTNDVLVKLGVDGVRALFEARRPYPIEGSFRVADSFESIYGIHENGYPEIAGCGDTAFDELLRFAPGHLTLVTGVPNHGKSSWLDNILLRQAVTNGWRVSYFSPEHEIEQHVHRHLEILTGKGLLPSQPNQMSRDELTSGARFIDERSFYIMPGDETFALDNILTIAEYHVRAFGVNALVIDPWNKIEHHIEKGENETMYTARTLNRMKAFAKKNRLHLFLVAHPRKMGKRMGSLGQQTVEIPTPYDVNGSSHFFNICDNCVSVYRETNADTGETIANDVYVQKVKHTFHGTLGKVSYKYIRGNQRFIPDAESYGHERTPWLDVATGKPALGLGSSTDTARLLDKQFGSYDEQPF